MQRFVALIILLSSVWGFSQTDEELIQEIKTFQDDLNVHYLDKETSPLKKKERKHFEGHRFFNIDLNYRVIAKVVLIENPDTIVMPTSAGTEKKYLRYAKLEFNIEGREATLIAYQSTKEGFQNYLFVPFRDATTGKDSYGGGRYIDLDLPESEEVVLNFNLAYNPYCAYTTGWFCPLPPVENTLEIAINAGLKVPLEH